ncbi:hypothetical protein KIH74_11080 [Kineosporia sp. J2-2]|uniref:Serine acetyltransferase n=1 Tax=Kineosporia corallincola TaxID=2835133 RepID=A0ABS5TH15_9ACTN|nr:DapH/DapD/GlmU-related protein [Kineosporia corallincola]MBT0769466.1 hypothetical protein [Kineosporia corallincola]
MTRPGLLATTLMRLQAHLNEGGAVRAAAVTRSVNSALTGADFIPGSVIGKSLLISHPNGIVVGRGTRIGDRAVLLQHVTLGELHADGAGPHAYPVLGDDVVIGAGACVLGGIRLGDGARVGANAVLTQDVPDGGLAVGVPARVIPAVVRVDARSGENVR